MARVNIFSQPDEDDYYSTSELVGWFDPQKAEVFEQDKRWDGNNMVGVITGSQWIDEYLYRTKSGRWVCLNDATRYHNGSAVYEFITDEQAKDWLLRSECNDNAVERFFGEIEEERGPGRPKVGEQVCFTVPAGDLAAIDAIAESESLARSAVLRNAVAEYVLGQQSYTVTVLDLQTRVREVSSRHGTLGAAVEALREEEAYDAEDNNLPSRRPRVEHDGRPVDVEESWT